MMNRAELSRRLALATCLCAALAAGAGNAWAQDAFPKKTVTIVVPYAATTRATVSTPPPAA